jgi:hypothetical protein
VKMQNIWPTYPSTVHYIEPDVCARSPPLLDNQSPAKQKRASRHRIKGLSSQGKGGKHRGFTDPCICNLRGLAPQPPQKISPHERGERAVCRALRNGHTLHAGVTKKTCPSGCLGTSPGLGGSRRGFCLRGLGQGPRDAPAQLWALVSLRDASSHGRRKTQTQAT